MTTSTKSRFRSYNCYWNS